MPAGRKGADEDARVRVVVGAAHDVFAQATGRVELHQVGALTPHQVTCGCSPRAHLRAILAVVQVRACYALLLVHEVSNLDAINGLLEILQRLRRRVAMVRVEVRAGSTRFARVGVRGHAWAVLS